MRIGPSYEVSPVNLVTLNGEEIIWSEYIRYLGVSIKAGRAFNCILDNAKRAFYRSFKAIFGKIGRVASEDVVVELVKVKCLPMLLYGVEACHLKKSQINSLQYAINCCFKKIFNTSSKDVVLDCMVQFDFPIIECAIAKRTSKFLLRYADSGKNNLMFSVFVRTALSS